MGDDDEMGEIQPEYRFGVEIYRFDGITAYAWRNWRFVWHDPRDRDNWKIDASFRRGHYQIGVGPALFGYVGDESDGKL